MTCADVERALLEGENTAAIAAHLGSCAACARLADAQRTLDTWLSSALHPPVLDASFRPALYARLQPPLTLRLDALPDVLHLASCAVITTTCAVLLPLEASLVLGAGTALTVTTYVAMALLRNSLDESTQ